MRRRWVWVALVLGGVTVVALTWALLVREGASQAEREDRATLRELDAEDAVLNGEPPAGAVLLREHLLDDCWNQASGAQEPVAARELDYDGDLAEVRRHYEPLLADEGWVQTSDAPVADELTFRRPVGDLTAELRISHHPRASRLWLQVRVDHQFCEE